MACEIYFSISRTAIELAVLGIVIAGTAYLVKDLMEEDEAADPVINPIEGQKGGMTARDIHGLSFFSCSRKEQIPLWK